MKDENRPKEIRIRAKYKNGSHYSGSFEPDALDSFTVEEVFADGHTRERQVFPKVTPARPLAPDPWKGNNS